MLGCVLAAVGQLMMAVPAETFAVLALSRVVAGSGMGIAAAAAQAAVSAAAQPDRLFGIFFAAFTPLGALLLLALPYLITTGGYGAGYAVLAAISLMAIPLVIWLPRPPIAAEKGNVPLDSAPRRAVAIPALVAVALIGASDLGMWTFIERIGSRAGLAPADIGEALAAATLAGSASAAIAAWLGTRVGRVIPVVVSFATMVGVAVALGSSSSAATYVPLVIVWSASVFVAYTYALGALAAADLSGRWSAAAAGARSVGGAIGPVAAGVVVGSGGYEGAGLLVGGSCALALVLSVPLATQLSRRAALSG
jgi:predicted MFS family arabinose efflux permease